jgi:hypothetical protein
MTLPHCYSDFWLRGAPLDAWPPDDTDEADLPPPTATELAAYGGLPIAVHRAIERLAYGMPLSGLTSFDSLATRRRKDRPMTAPTRAELEQAQVDTPAFPDGEPNDHWSNNELRAYAEHHERQLPCEQPAPIRWDSFSADQLKALARCKTEQEAQQLLGAFARGEQPPAPVRRRPVKVTW